MSKNHLRLGSDRTFGFEITGIVTPYSEKRDGFTGDSLTSDHTQSISTHLGACVAADLIRDGYNDFDPEEDYTDTHCIEFPSPVFRKWSSALKFFRTVRRSFEHYRITPQNPITVCGGNHLHFSVDDPTKLRNVMRDISRRWFLPWVFTQPDDTDSCNNLCTDRDMWSVHRLCRNYPEMLVRHRNTNALPDNVYNVYNARLRNTSERLGLPDLTYYQFLVTDKGTAEWGDATSSNTKGALATTRSFDLDNGIEFRCVEAPLTEAEFVDQFEFFHAYLKWAEVNGGAPMQMMTPTELNSIRPQEAVGYFRGLCKLIGVDAARYEKYVRRNLYPRWQLGRRRY